MPEQNNDQESQSNENIYPIANWDLGPIEEHQLVVFRPHFISATHQTKDDAEVSRYYAMTIEQAKQLRLALESAIAVLERQ